MRGAPQGPRGLQRERLPRPGTGTATLPQVGATGDGPAAAAHA